MASVRSVIELAIIGSTRGLGAAAAEARAMAERVAAAEDRVSEARTRSAAAEDRVGVAEQRLQAARDGQEAALNRIGVAETNLEHIRATSNESTTRLARAQADLDAVRSRAGASAEEIARAESRVNQVRTESDAASRRLQQAEAQLATARANAERSGSSVAAAEAAIARARSEAIRASEDLARRENDLNIIRRRGNSDVNQQRDGILGIFDALSRLSGAFSGADGASTSFLSKMAALNSVFSSIGGPIVQTVVGILQIIAVMGALGEIVGLVGGLIGQVLGGAPAVLLALGAAAGTAALGMDGIKKAAELLQPAFAKLQKQVSDTFVLGLTPAFKQLAAVIPQFTAGFRAVALALSGIAGQVIGFITSAKGIADINGILLGTRNLLQGIAPGLRTFVQGLLDAANIGGRAFSDLGAAIGSVFDRIGSTLSTLAANGTIGLAVQGFAATLKGLGDVVAPVISLFIQMGAALGDSVGQALTDLGAGIERVTPFFVQLADVAGKVLVDAFNQLGPPLAQLVDSILPGAGQGFTGFATLMHSVVLPAIAGFINFLRTDAIPGFIAFSRAIIINATAFASSLLGALSGVLAALHGFFAAMALIPGPLQETFAKAAAVTDAFRGSVDQLKVTIDGVHDKTVQVLANTDGTVSVIDMKNQIALTNSKKVDVTATTPDTPKIVDMHTQIALTNSKAVDVTANVPDTPRIVDMHNQIALTNSKRVDINANVPDTPKVVDLWTQIGRVLSKTVNVVANVFGLGAVLDLISAIGNVVSKTVDIVTNFITNTIARRRGGPVSPGQTYLVGEDGPELLALDGRGGFVTTASRTQQILAGQTAVAGSGKPASTGQPAAPTGGDAPITVNVMLSQDQIAGIAQVEIQRRDRATKRTVLAGSGVTF